MGFEEGEEKWVNHYSSNHQMLLVGDGDFSFSLSLAHSLGSASNIVASSLDSYDEVISKYKNAKPNLVKLEKLGASHLHGVDATKMKFHSDLKMRRFDRIIFGFPHAGFCGRRESDIKLINKHKELVSSFFANARGMLRPFGEIHVNHKTTPPFCCWNLEELASRNSLALVKRVDFNKQDYPGYSNKRGDGSRCNEPFPLGKSSTFIFSLFHPSPQKAPPRLQSLIVSVNIDAAMRNGTSPLLHCSKLGKTEPSRRRSKNNRSRTRSARSKLVKPDQSRSSFVTSFARNLPDSDLSRRLQSKTPRYSPRSPRERDNTESSRSTSEIRSRTRSYSVKPDQSFSSHVTCFARNIPALDWSRRLQFNDLAYPVRDTRKPNNLRSSDGRSPLLTRLVSENQFKIWSNSVESDQSRFSSISSFASNIHVSDWSYRLRFDDLTYPVRYRGSNQR